jgi:hypothetical protein
MAKKRSARAAEPSLLPVLAFITLLILLVAYMYFLRNKEQMPRPNATAPSALEPMRTGLRSKVALPQFHEDGSLHRAVSEQQDLAAIVPETKACCGPLVSSVLNPAHKSCASAACSIIACGANDGPAEPFGHL